MKNKILIIDGDNLLHRAYHKFGGLVNQKGKPTSSIYGFPYILRSMVNKFKPDILYVAFDGGKHDKRVRVLPDYKKREHKADFDYEDFLHQKKVVIDLVFAFGAIVLHKKGMEADDLIYSLIKKEKLEEHYVTLVSSDKDFHQLLNHSIKIYNPFKDKLITIKNVKELYGYTSDQATDYLIIDGDKSDNIPGYPNMGPKRISDFFNDFNSIGSYLSSDSSHRIMEKSKLKEIYKRNKLLIDLRYFYLKFLRKEPLPYLNGVNNKHKMLTVHIAKICNIYDINTLLKPEFIETFKRICV